VQIEVSPGLQTWLNADPRMRAWMDKAIAVVDACYAELRRSDGAATGVVELNVTMHQNARPSASVGSMPWALKGVASCVTTHLFGVKMPLFTGREGDRQTLRVELIP
jgi:hypothetical protein